MQTAKDLVCWKCGVTLESVSLPLRRLEECPSCTAQLYVCRMCEYYDPTVAKSCREPVAEKVRDKERANFCDYLEPRRDAYRPPDRTAQARARAELEALFGDSPPAEQGSAPGTDTARDRLEALFKKKP